MYAGVMASTLAKNYFVLKTIRVFGAHKQQKKDYQK
jgi:hypothetical protein